MSKRLDPQALRPGYYIHVRHPKRWTGRLIRRSLSIRVDLDKLPFKCVWGDHDALVCMKLAQEPSCDRILLTNQIFIGDSHFPKAELTPLSEYQRMLAEGEIEVKVFRPRQYSLDRGLKASNYWQDHINGHWYDTLAYPKIFLRCLFGADYDWAAGLKVLKYCTEGVMEAWRDGAGYDPYLNRTPTPLTTEKRLDPRWGGTLEDITDLCVVDVDESVPCGDV